MNKYKISIKSKGVYPQPIQAENPQYAFTKLYPNIELYPRVINIHII